MKRTLHIPFITLVVLIMAGSASAQKIGYVNSAELLSEMPEVQQAEANLEALQEQLQKRGQWMVEKLQQDYLTIQQKIERGELSPAQQESEAKKLETRRAEIATFEQQMVQQIQDKRDETLEPIHSKINAAIAAVAKENGFLFIFDQGVLLYGEQSLDVSALVKAKL